MQGAAQARDQVTGDCTAAARLDQIRKILSEHGRLRARLLGTGSTGRARAISGRSPAVLLLISFLGCLATFFG